MTPGAMKNHGMKKGAKKKTSAYEEDEAEDEFDLEIAAEEAEAREREEAANRKGAITVEELDDDAYDPYPDPEWKGDKTDLAKAQVDALLRERSARANEATTPPTSSTRSPRTSSEACRRRSRSKSSGSWRTRRIRTGRTARADPRRRWT